MTHSEIEQHHAQRKIELRMGISDIIRVIIAAIATFLLSMSFT